MTGLVCQNVLVCFSVQQVIAARALPCFLLCSCFIAELKCEHAPRGGTPDIIIPACKISPARQYISLLYLLCRRLTKAPKISNGPDVAYSK